MQGFSPRKLCGILRLPPKRPTRLLTLHNMLMKIVLFVMIFLFSIPTVAASKASLIAVIDGDSLIAQVDGTLVAVRLIGIDAPEMFDRNDAPRQDGDAAAARLRVLIQNRPILLESDPAMPRTDPYGRMLAYVYRAADGVLLNKQMLCDGYARLYRGQQFSFQREFAECEAQAVALRRGLWGGSGYAAQWESRFPGTKYLGEANPGARASASAPRPPKKGATPAPRRTRRRPR